MALVGRNLTWDAALAISPSLLSHCTPKEQSLEERLRDAKKSASPSGRWEPTGPGIQERSPQGGYSHASPRARWTEHVRAQPSIREGAHPEKQLEMGQGGHLGLVWTFQRWLGQQRSSARGEAEKSQSWDTGGGGGQRGAGRSEGGQGRLPDVAPVGHRGSSPVSC